MKAKIFDGSKDVYVQHAYGFKVDDGHLLVLKNEAGTISIKAVYAPEQWFRAELVTNE
jgi:hypothetical protein